MKEKVDVNDLRLNMYVVDLDRPWLETPFLFQGFPLSTREDIETIKKYCKYVYIEAEPDVSDRDIRPPLVVSNPVRQRQTSQAPAPKLSPIPEKGRKSGSDKDTAPKRVYKKETSFEEEIEEAREIRTEARHVIENVFEDVRLGRSIDAEGAKHLVRRTAESIVRSPDAQLWLTQLKNKDEYTSIHSMNVCVLSLAFGRHLGLPEDTLNILGLGALLHDVGKICTPLDILHKPDKLTDKEFEIMKRHPTDGMEIVSETKGIPAGAMDVVYSHHERFSGSGYPRGLPSKHISLFSKVVAIVDVYDAITSDRIYHKGMDTLDAAGLLYESGDRDFDADLVEQFVKCLGIYPVGSLVEMNTGEVGIVISFQRGDSQRPKLLVVLDANKQYYKPPYIKDLQQCDKTGPSACYITDALIAGSYDLNISDYIMLAEQLIKK